MPDIPNRTNADSFFGAAWNKNREAVRSHQPLQAPGVLTSHTVHGIFREAQEVTPGYAEPVPTGFQTYRTKSALGDYLICRTWDGTTEGTTDVKVAKNFDSRQIASETLEITEFTYVYEGDPDELNRYRTSTNTDTTDEEIQQVTPLWKVDGLIAVGPINFSDVLVDDVDLKLIESSSRCWSSVDALPPPA